MSNNRADRMQNRMANAQKRANDASENEKQRSAVIDLPEGTDSAASIVTEESPVGAAVATAAPENTTPAPKAADAYADKSDIVRTIVAHFEDYAQRGAPGRSISPDEILSLQKMLLRNVDQMVNLPSVGDFATCYSRLLKLMAENANKAFAANMMLRSFSRLPQSDTVLNRARFFLDMSVAFSDPSQRRLLISRWNLEQAAEIAKPEYRERIVAFIREISGQ